MEVYLEGKRKLQEDRKAHLKNWRQPKNSDISEELNEDQFH